MRKVLLTLVSFTFLFFANSACLAQESKEQAPNSDIDQMFPELKGEALAQDSKHRKLVEGIVEKMRKANSPEEAIRAAVALQSVVNASDVAYLSQILKDPKPEHIQVELLRALGSIGDPRAGNAIRFEIKHGTMPIKIAGVDALGSLNHSWVVPVLTRHLVNGESSIIRQRAASGLGRMKSQQAVYALREARNATRGGVSRAVDWAIAYAMGQVNEERIDQKIPSGRKLRRTYKGMVYNVYFPTPNPRNPVRPRLLVCLHGRDLDYNGMFASCVEKAEERDIAVIAPYFDNIRFPDFGTFNIHGTRSDKFLLELIDHVSGVINAESRQFLIYGHGQGGDLAMRMAMVYPERIARAAAMVESFTVLDDKIMFPQGIKSSPFAPDVKINPEVFLRADLALMVDQSQKDNWSGKLFYQAVGQISSSQGIYPRLTRAVIGKYRSYKYSWEVAEKFLFWRF